jgi:hypothetical protein
VKSNKALKLAFAITSVVLAAPMDASAVSQAPCQAGCNRVCLDPPSSTCVCKCRPIIPMSAREKKAKQPAGTTSPPKQ